MEHQVSSWKYCQRTCPEGQKFCSEDHKSNVTICWMPSCNISRYRHENGAKAPGCSRSHTAAIKDHLSGARNCWDGNLQCTCLLCQPYDLRDVLHIHIITGEECYCHPCKDK